MLRAPLTLHTGAALGPSALERWLDAAAHRLAGSPHTGAVIEQIMADLWCLRRASSSLDGAAWREAIAAVRRHRLMELMLEDPFTRHAFTRPHGYPGDADLLDFIYDGDEHAARPPAGSLGQRIFSHNVRSYACAAVRWRMHHLAARLAALGPDRRVLVVACGHLREASLALGERGALPQVLAVDQDPRAVAYVEGAFEGAPVTARRASVRDLLLGSGPDELDQEFDLIYAAGLYDYLEERVAVTLNMVLAKRLARDGRLLVANFLPDIHGSGYMETFMDWHLTYRDANRLEDTLRPLPRLRVVRSYTDPHAHVVFTEGAAA